jgi:hypothetical protein
LAEDERLDQDLQSEDERPVRQYEQAASRSGATENEVSPSIDSPISE